VDVGKALNRDISSGEIVDADLSRLIERRHEQRVAEEGEREAEEAWQESVRKHNAARDAELRAAWCEYHQEQGRRHRAVLEALVAHHEQRAEALTGGEMQHEISERLGRTAWPRPQGAESSSSAPAEAKLLGEGGSA
jgi:hypothetical protein